MSSLKNLLLSTTALAALLPLATAHSWVKSVNVAGKEYRGWDFNADPYYPDATRPPSYTRKNDGNGPCLDWTQKCIIVNEGANAEKFEATTPTQTIPAKGGDSVTLDWQQWPDSHIGGQAVYMADCGATCEGADTASLSWFKIIEENYDTATSTWPLSLLTKNPLYTFNLPTDLPSGSYMVKHELLAPFSGQQFYPMAFQVDLESSGTTVPAPTGKFPDMYADFVELTTDGPSFKYPGIAVYQGGIVKGDSGGAASSPGAPAAPEPPASSAVVEPVTTEQGAEPTDVAATSTAAAEAPVTSTAAATSTEAVQVPAPSASEQPEVVEPTTSASSDAPTPTEVVVPALPEESEDAPIETMPSFTEELPNETATSSVALPSSSVPPVDLPVPTSVSAPTPTESATEPEGPAVPAPPPTGSAEGDLQKFTGSVGAPIGAVTQVGNQYSSGGRTYNYLYDALEESCNEQRNACYNASNKLPNGEVGAFQRQCETQTTECYTVNRAQASVARRWSSRSLAL